MAVVILMLVGNIFLFCAFHARVVVSLAVLVLGLFQLFQDVLRLPCRRTDPTERKEQEAAQQEMRKHGKLLIERTLSRNAAMKSSDQRGLGIPGSVGTARATSASSFLNRTSRGPESKRVAKGAAGIRVAPRQTEQHFLQRSLS